MTSGRLFDGVVRDLRAEPFGGNDFGSRTAGFKHCGEDFFATAAVILPASTNVTSSPSAAGFDGRVISLPEC